MCAINGVTKNDHARVARMNEMTRHRGPDGSRVWEGNGVTLGHNRLAIIDLSDRALQPMHSADRRYTIVFNGEIYNYRELRRELEGLYQFTTESDTEVLIAAYTHWGESMFSRLRGMFAFGIWDSETETLSLARDHMGIKPLYYMVNHDSLTFSSEVGALLATNNSPRIDHESVAFYLSMEYVPAPRSLAEGISKLPPGHVLRFRQGKTQITSFLNSDPTVEAHSITSLYETIDTAVKRHLISDRPVGAYLSGGFDSSIVVHHMTKHSPHTRTYSVDFEAVAGEEAEAEKFNKDAALARKTAAFYGTEHKTLTITLEDVRARIETVAAGANEPIANSTAITQHLLSDYVQKDGVVVVLGGDGGDELFGGYTRHRIAMAAYMYQKLPQFIQQVGARFSPRIGKLSLPFGAPLHMALMVKDEKKIRQFVKLPLGIHQTVSSFFASEYVKESERSPHPFDAFMRVDRRTWLPDECFIRSDFASMAHGIELRVPLVDLDLVRLSDRIMPRQKTLPFEGKRIIRKEYKPYLPAHLYGEPKRGWLSPAAKWFRDPIIHEFAQSVFSSSYYSGLDGLFDWDGVQTALEAHVEKRAYTLYPLWNILVLQIWARNHKVIYES
jgi:asparagine synthase (glutamine-hydrolysing)